jgi:hypothetical protein
MTDSLKLGGALPNEPDLNGLDEVAAQVVKNPTKMVPFIMLADCGQITEKTDIGNKIGTLRVRRIEPIGPQDLDAAHKLFRRILDRRLGKNALPISDLDEIDITFGASGHGGDDE